MRIDPKDRYLITSQDDKIESQPTLEKAEKGRKILQDHADKNEHHVVYEIIDLLEMRENQPIGEA